MQLKTFLIAFLLPCLLSVLAAPPARSDSQTAASSQAASKSDFQPFQNLKTTHPRLLLQEHTAEYIKRSASSYDDKKQDYDMLVKKGQDLLALPVVQHHGGDLLDVSRTVLKRVQTLAFLYRADGDSRWLNKAKSELLAAAAFPDWHPDHFLDTAEMMTALATGYDWLYDGLTPRERRTICASLISKGLIVSKDFYDNDRDFWVKDNTTNWNIVCNSSILMAALAVGTDDGGDKALASEMATRSLEHLRQGLANYAPDGGWDEGTTYWHYATIYATRALSSLQSACGGDFGLSNAPGLSQTGDFILAMVSPTGLAFNFADSVPNFDSCPELLWLAKRYNRPVLAWKERDQLKKDRSNISALDFVWWNDSGSADNLSDLNCAQYFAGRPQAVAMRSSWTDPLSSYVGFVGGSNASHHSHLGLGNFVYDFNGVRWVTLLGPDDYKLPGYFDLTKGNQSQRWQYYRNNSMGQNVMLFGGASQDSKADAAIVERQLDNAKPVNYAICDLTKAYANCGVTSMRRGVALYKEQGKLLVQDEFATSNPLDAVWQIHTRAKVQISDSHRAVLSIGARQIEVELLAPEFAHFEQAVVAIPAPQGPATGTTRLLVKLDNVSKSGSSSGKGAEKITVLFAPYDQPSTRKATLPKVVPLANWKSSFGTQLKRSEILPKN